MQSEQVFNPEHYLKGRVALPPSVLSKPSEPFVYGGDISVLNGNSATLQIQINDDSHFLVEQIAIFTGQQGIAQDAATVQITDTSTSRSWSNTAVPLRDIAGLGMNPKYLQHPNLLKPTTTLAVQITNNVGSTQQFYVALIGRKIYGLEKFESDFMSRRMWYQYVMNVPSLGASVNNQSAELQVYNESDFMVFKLISQQLINAVIGATGGAVSNEVLVSFKDTTTDKSLFNQPVAARLVIGAYAGEIVAVANSWGYGLPECIKKPWLIRRNGKITGYFTNLSTTAISGGFNVVFEGIRIFDAA